MEPISNADRLVMVLRQKLRERSKADRTQCGGGKASVAEPKEPSGIKAMAEIGSADERPLRRAVIQNLLADQLGPELVNDSQFQQIVSRVTETIEDDADASQLLSRVVNDILS